MTGEIRFNDGAAYEEMMGKWSRLAGIQFLDWLAPRPALRWVDVGCGSGAFTELLVERCAPSAVDGIDPSEGQLAFARTRPAARLARFHVGGAEALPFADASFDAAVMALVIVFVPDPAKGVAELARVVASGGLVAAYMWDFPGGGFPLDPLRAELTAIGIAGGGPPSPAAGTGEALAGLWRGAGLAAVETREIVVRRTFDDFESYWRINLSSPSLGPAIAKLAPADVERVRAGLQARVRAPASGSFSLPARANAVRGRRV